MRSPAACLRDFSAPRARPAPLPPRDVAAEIARAYADGIRDGREAARAEAADDRAAAQGLAEKEAQQGEVELRARWTGETARLFADGLAEAVERCTQDIATDVAAILADIAVLARRSVLADDTVRQLLPILRDRDAVKVELSGPPDLLAAIGQRLEGHNVIVGQVSEAAELHLRVDRTVLGTQLERWRSVLLQAVGLNGEEPGA